MDFSPFNFENVEKRKLKTFAFQAFVTRIGIRVLVIDFPTLLYRNNNDKKKKK